MISEHTTDSIFGGELHVIRKHRRPTNTPSFVRPIALLLILVISSPFLVTSVLPQDAPVKPLSEPYTAWTHAPLTFPTPPYVAPPEARTEGTERAARTERKQVSKVEIVVSFALAQVGKRYAFGSKGPNTYDCSGLVVAAFAVIGMSLYHYTGKLMTYGQRVARSDLQRGDIVFPSGGHVGIYLGDGKFLHSSSGRGKVVVDGKFDFYTARRLL